MTAAEIAAYLASRGTWTYSRASGPGGQRRDHVATQARLEITSADLQGLPAPIAARLHDALALADRPLRLRAGTERLREHNRARVLARLEARVRGALEPPSAPRRPTRPSRGAVERRLADKRRRAATKAGRQTPDD
jgi:ribosome-associated protein